MKNLLIIIFLLTLFGCKKSDDGTVEVIPLAPTELKGTIISKDQVDLTWKDNSTNETGYKIERKNDSGNFTEIGSTATDVTTFSDKTVSLNTNYTYRVYSINKVGKSINYSNEFSIKTINIPTLTTIAITDISASYSGAKSGGNISSDGGAAILSRGLVWGTTINPTIALSTKTSDGTGVGAFQSVISGLAASNKYYVRAYASNSAGTAYGEEISFSTFYTVVGANDKIWMDRNLGATQVATSSTDYLAYGSLYQWGRRADGHEKITWLSATYGKSINTDYSGISSLDSPLSSYFILSAQGNMDWRNPQNNNLWQGVNGVNNPCPSGFRLPTSTEWEVEKMSWASQDALGAFKSPLKLPLAGLRGSSLGSVTNTSSYGYYWSSSVSGAYSLWFVIGSAANVGSYYRANGLCVRCIKD